MERKKSNNAKVTHSERGKRSAVLAPAYCRRELGSVFGSALQESSLSAFSHLAAELPSRLAPACSFWFSLLFHDFVQHSSLGHARTLFSLLAVQQDYLVFCSASCNKPIGLASPQ